MTAAMGDFVLDLGNNVYNPDLPTLAASAGWNGRRLLFVNITAALSAH